MAKKVSTMVTEYLLEQIKLENYQIGDKLPSERELMQILNVGRSSLREALNTLVDMDVVEKRMGIGVFVKKTDFTNLVDSYVLSVLLDTEISGDLLEFRLMLEVESAGLAALKATDQELKVMEQAITKHILAIEQEKPTIEADELFHKSIVLATRNSVFIRVYHFLADLLHSFKQDLLKVENKEKSLQYHQEIYQAIKTRNKLQAKAVMREHLLEVTNRYMHAQKQVNKSYI
ncbi:transcriptional regulator [Mesobacillus campisalis]|uniref:Transcriptional regulator n=1 Tax=Mesobacillus campisalis TaxID=1408103 RepID=A0A0M2T3S8_9BACI|nr:FadR/GntR family transcriptional regulator [Mesobacillus campisalis]KKK39912.1 transcriptional regulator [Mesobacillus campisalis]